MSTHFRRDERGFTLIEILIVVAIIALVASMAIPALQSAMLKSKRNSTVSDLRVFRDAMQGFAADMDRYPLMKEFNVATLAPLDRGYLQHPSKILRLLKNKKVDWYIPWDILHEPLEFSAFVDPQGYIMCATLAYDTSIRFLVTDTEMYYYIDQDITPVGEN